MAMTKRTAHLLTSDFCLKGHDIRDKEVALTRHNRRNGDGEIVGVTIRCRVCWNDTSREQMYKFRKTAGTPALQIKRLLIKHPELAPALLEHAKNLLLAQAMSVKS